VSSTSSQPQAIIGGSSKFPSANRQSAAPTQVAAVESGISRKTTYPTEEGEKKEVLQEAEQSVEELDQEEENEEKVIKRNSAAAAAADEGTADAVDGDGDGYGDGDGGASDGQAQPPRRARSFLSRSSLLAGVSSSFFGSAKVKETKANSKK
jgi:hypothetical protein